MSARSLVSLAIGIIGAAACGIPRNPSSDRSSESVPSCGTPFEYHGCAIVNLNGFSDPVDVPTGQLTHATCQTACEGNQIVAIFAESCRCGNDSGAFQATDPSVCDNPCLGDPSLGMCGSQCPENGHEISTIYIAIEEPPVDPAPIPPPAAEGPQPSATIFTDPPAQPRITGAPPPPPEVPEDPLSQTVITEPEPRLTIQSVEPSTVPADPEETIPGDSQGDPSPTPSMVMADACSQRFNSRSLVGGVLLYMLMAA